MVPGGQIHPSKDPRCTSLETPQDAVFACLSKNWCNPAAKAYIHSKVNLAYTGSQRFHNGSS